MRIPFPRKIKKAIKDNIFLIAPLFVIGVILGNSLLYISIQLVAQSVIAFIFMDASIIDLSIDNMFTRISILFTALGSVLGIWKGINEYY
tara:strand:- start:51191 stop:51460 length:270 start_codon:yes stop_codon:yes gene_type:complete